MKKQKTIIIRSKNLKNLRKNLRMIIRLAVHNELMRLMELTSKYDHIGKYKNGKNRTQEEIEKSRELTDKENTLRFSVKKSICLCNMCKEYDNDMVFFPFFNEWFCIDCYNTHYEGWMESTKLGKEQADLLEKEK